MNRAPAPLLGGIGRLIADVELHANVPDGPEERFSGYGVWSLPFASGYVLALRRFPASSIGLAYSAVWLRDPAGRWTIFSDARPDLSCARYASDAIEEAITTPIRLHWAGPGVLRVEIPGRLSWEIALRTNRLTRAFTSVLRLLPPTAWRSRVLMRVAEWLAGPLLVGGRIAMHGRMPNGHRFRVAPRAVLAIEQSRAILDGVDLGSVGPVAAQPHLGEMLLPQGGMFAVGDIWFERELTRAGRAPVPGGARGAPHSRP
jgi:hypothetical protein